MWPINELGKDASVMTQLYGVIVTIVYTAVATAIILYVIKAIVGLRPSEAAKRKVSTSRCTAKPFSRTSKRAWPSNWAMRT